MVLTKKPLSKAIKTFYGLGDMGFSFMTSVELFFFVFFLTNVAQFSLPMVAIIGSVTSIVDALSSPFQGAIISGTKAMKWGRNRSWMLVTPPIVVVLFMLQFTRIGPSEAISAAIVTIGFIVSHFIWNICWVANVSLIPVMATNAEERGFLASKRATWTSLAGVFFSYIGQPLALYLGIATGSEVLGYTLLAGCMAALMMLGMWTVFKITDGYEATGEEEAAMAAASKNVQQKVTLGGMMRNVVKNPPLLILLLGDFFRFMGFFIITASVAYYFSYVAQDMSMMPFFMFVTAVAAVIGAYLSGWLTKKLSARIATIGTMFAVGIALIVGNFVGMNVTMFFIFAALGRMLLGTVSATFVALYTDVAIYGEWKTGESATSFVMGLMQVSLKTAIISRGTVIPLALALAGFDQSIDPAAATEAVRIAVINVNMLYPGIAAIVSGLILAFGFKLTKEQVATMQEEIDARKEEAAIKAGAAS